MSSWVLAAVLHVIHPSLFSESLVVHLVNFVLYLLALAAFEFFLNRLIESRNLPRPDVRDLVPTISDGALRVLGYSLFIWSSLFWLKLPLETPDMLLSIWIYLAAGLLLRIGNGTADGKTFAALGLSLGFGYLTKSVLFPISILFLAMAALAARRRPKTTTRLATAIAAFLLVASPWVITISVSKNRFTFGDAGKLAYIAFANGYTDRDAHWNRYFPDDT